MAIIGCALFAILLIQTVADDGPRRWEASEIPDWEIAPNKHFRLPASYHGGGAAVRVTCTVAEDLRTFSACVVEAEEPQNQGLGRAAIGSMMRARLGPAKPDLSSGDVATAEFILSDARP